MNWKEYNSESLFDFEIEVTYKDQKGLKHIFYVYGVNEKGEFVMDLIKEEKQNEKPKFFEKSQRRVLVDKDWFYIEQKRIIKKI